MDFKKIVGKAKKAIDDRGGVEALKGDAQELKGVAKGRGSLADKAKKAASVLKEPGAAAGGGARKGRAGAHQPRPANASGAKPRDPHAADSGQHQEPR
jgi:hypothetical protein